MPKDFKREAYAQLVKWKERVYHATLEVSGARQVGKTYLVNKFADEQYCQKVYINLLGLSGEIFLANYNDLWTEMKNGKRYENPLNELMKRQEPDFVDSTDTIIIIDEIQESADIYNRVREFTRSLKSDVIVTGSYLGRILNKDFKYSSGDLDTLEIQTLNFREFLVALQKERLFDSLNIFGQSEEIIYHELEELYQIYCTIGGYPAVVLQYVETSSVENCQVELLRIIRLFARESKRYFDDILDDAIYDNLFSSIARILVREKKGLEADSFSEDLQKIVTRDYSSKISKASVNRAIDWLYSSGIIGYAGKVVNCDILDFKPKSRCFYMDIGLTTYFLTKIGCKQSDRSGIVNENFVYLDLRRRIINPEEITLETPAFATWGDGEIDFFVQSIENQKTFAVEVKTGKNSSKTITDVQKSDKIDYVLFAKGNTHGGKTDDSITIPIYGIAKFRFE